MMRTTRHGLLALTWVLAAAAGVRAEEPTTPSPREAAVPVERIVPAGASQTGVPASVGAANRSSASGSVRPARISRLVMWILAVSAG